MVVQTNLTPHNVPVADEQGIKDLYQKLGIPIDEKQNDDRHRDNSYNNYRDDDQFKDYWPPIPEYSVKHSVNVTRPSI